MKTQSIKLNKVLHNGSLRQIKAEELYNEIDSMFNENGTFKNGCASLYTKKEMYKDVQNHILNGRCCWEFIPYEGIDSEKTRQYSDNPFTLINYIYTELRK